MAEKKNEAAATEGGDEIAVRPGEVDPAVAADANGPEMRTLPDGTEVEVERNSDVTEAGEAQTS